MKMLGEDSNGASSASPGPVHQVLHSDHDPASPTPRNRTRTRAGETPSGQAVTATASAQSPEPGRRERQRSSFFSFLGSSAVTSDHRDAPDASQGLNNEHHNSATTAEQLINASPVRPALQAKPSNASTSASSWRLPWSSAKKKAPVAEPAREINDAGDASDDSGMDTPTESLHTIKDFGEVVDEGISMSDTSGKVDFLTSLPLELSLYVLLFADKQTVCRAMQVSPTWKSIASDALIWREFFYRNPGWEIRPEYLESARNELHSRGTEAEGTLMSPSKTPQSTRTRHSTTATSESTIAARIGKKIGDIVSEIGFMSLRTGQGASAEGEASQATESADLPVGRRGSVPGLATTSPQGADTADQGPAGSLLHTTPSRTRSSTATSSAATHTSSFYTPLRNSMRQSSAPLGPSPSRRPSQSFSIVQSLLETHGSTNIHGVPLGPQVNREKGAISPQGADTSFRTPLKQATALRSRQVSYSSPRAGSIGAMSPLRDFEFDLEPSASLFLDWKGLYRDRLELERRWDNDLFTTRTLKGHTDSVYCVAVRNDTIISGGRDHAIKVWDVHCSQPLRTVEAHTASVLCVYYDGIIMVTGSSAAELFVWDVNSWTVTDILKGHTAGVLDVQGNDKWIASCSKDTSIRIWKRDTKEAYRVLQGHRGPVNAIQLHNDTLVSASGDALAKMWDIEQGRVIRVFKGHVRGLACLQYNGEVLLTGSNDHTIRVWNVQNGECVKVLKGHKDLVRTLSYDALRKRVLSGSYDKTTRLWDLETGHLKMTFQTSHRSFVFDVSIDVSRVVSSSHDRRIVVIDYGEGLDARRFV